MFNLDDITTKNYRKLIIRPSGSGKTNLIQFKKTTISLIKFICMPKIYQNQNINFCLKKENKQVLKI